MKSNKINIAVTEIPVICGMNPYENIKKTIVKHWKMLDQEMYNYMIESGFDKPLTNNNEKIDYYTKKYNLSSLTEDAKTCSSSTNAKELQTSKKNIISKIESDNNIPINEKEDLKKQIDSLVYTGYGIKKESDAINIYIKQSGINVIENQKCVRKLFITSGNVSWYVIGKVDGLTEDGTTIIEIKNRTKNLFKTIVDYEKIQMMTYMKLFRKQKCNLVECLDKKINVIELQYDDKFWNMIDIHLQKYVKFMTHFILNQDEMIKILTTPDNEYQAYYLEWTV